jgi:hypothetical protein
MFRSLSKPYLFKPFIKQLYKSTIEDSSKFIYIGSQAINKEYIFVMALDSYGPHLPFESKVFQKGAEIAYIGYRRGNNDNSMGMLTI